MCFDLSSPDCYGFPSLKDKQYEFPNIPDGFDYTSSDRTDILKGEVAFQTQGGCPLHWAIGNSPVWQSQDSPELSDFRRGEIVNEEYGIRANKNVRMKTNHAKHQREWFVVFDLDKLLDKKQSAWVLAAGEFRANEMGIKTDYNGLQRLGLECLAQLLQGMVGNKAWIFNTPKRGMPKAIMAMAYDEPVYKPRKADALAILKHHFREYVEAAKHDPNSLFQFIISSKMKNVARIALPAIVPTRIITSKQNCVVLDDDLNDDIDQIKEELQKLPSTYVYAIDSKLSPTLEYLNPSKGYQAFLNCLVRMAPLVKKGFGISQNVLARTLGITQKTASYYIKKAKLDGLLAVKSHSYCPDVKAKTYLAIGKLKKAIKKLKGNRIPKIIPKSILNGQWHQTLKDTLIGSFYNRPHDFIAWVQSLPDSHIGDRIYQAKQLVQWFLKKRPQFS